MENENEWIDCWKKPVKMQYRKITKTEEITTREGKLYGYAGKDVFIFNATYTTTEPLSEEAIRASERSRIKNEILTRFMKAKGEDLFIKITKAEWQAFWDDIK